MATINIENITEGMILAADVKDRSGRILLAAGHQLTEKHLRIFKMWGITEADISGVQEEEVAARAVANLDPLRVQEGEAAARELFIHADLTHPVMKELFRLCAIRIAQMPQEGAEHGS